MKLKAKRVILAVRSLEKGGEAKLQLETETKRVGVAEVWHLDMCSYKSVKDFAAKVNKLERVDAIIENAGIANPMPAPAEGLEAILTVNVVSTMLLAVLVMPKLQESARKFGKETHLSFVGSGVAFGAKGVLEKFDGDLIEQLSEDKASMGKRFVFLIPILAENLLTENQRYQTSKLLELYAVRQFASLWPVSKTGVIINYINPGLCKTGLSNGAPFVFRMLIRGMLAVWGRTGEEGSKTLVYTTVSGKDTHGKYVSECRDKE
jgi:NAD(P)-dependent dehydrogenase (short-subunit alcohol dehydrogenase family)